jgi:hypothetical protein
LISIDSHEFIAISCDLEKQAIAFLESMLVFFNSHTLYPFLLMNHNWLMSWCDKSFLNLYVWNTFFNWVHRNRIDQDTWCLTIRLWRSLKQESRNFNKCLVNTITKMIR